MISLCMCPHSPPSPNLDNELLMVILLYESFTTPQMSCYATTNDSSKWSKPSRASNRTTTTTTTRMQSPRIKNMRVWLNNNCWQLVLREGPDLSYPNHVWFCRNKNIKTAAILTSQIYNNCFCACMVYIEHLQKHSCIFISTYYITRAASSITTVYTLGK